MSDEDFVAPPAAVPTITGAPAAVSSAPMATVAAAVVEPEEQEASNLAPPAAVPTGHKPPASPTLTSALLPSNLPITGTSFEAVAGHGTIIDLGDGIVAKRSEIKELAFYQKTEEYRFNPPNILIASYIDFIPRFYGEYSTPPAPKDGSHPSPNERWIRTYNATSTFTKPCTIDIKIGTQLYENDASLLKKVRMSVRSMVTTVEATGMLLCGMKIYDPPSGHYLKFPKSYGYALNTVTLPLGLRQFFCDGKGRLVHRAAIPILVTKLERLRDTLSELNGIRLRGSSLLLVYEGDTKAAWDPENYEKYAPQAHADVYSIDFNHSYFSTDQPGPDSVYLTGLNNLITTLSAVYAMPLEPPSSAAQVVAPTFGAPVDEWKNWFLSAPVYASLGDGYGSLTHGIDHALDSWKSWAKGIPVLSGTALGTTSSFRPGSTIQASSTVKPSNTAKPGSSK
ncbi:uncharacterized protein BJ171DRAFT_489577 [Polychytrium aggregatum]|uniref:uncharacterized protein n=1 Tax=Polychytrium aggregatum TaxID=110093 RepID=UPI0022FE08FE|nr:uncharacterized protein BJ171DRAFT_489577 [Polychytrium aggregatum]KAI9208646.1 hypothetical protein BJ171DRAFT_489577 [Polychytrium aggregatum]